MACKPNQPSGVENCCTCMLFLGCVSPVSLLMSLTLVCYVTLWHPLLYNIYIYTYICVAFRVCPLRKGILPVHYLVQSPPPQCRAAVDLVTCVMCLYCGCSFCLFTPVEDTVMLYLFVIFSRVFIWCWYTFAVLGKVHCVCLVPDTNSYTCCVHVGFVHSSLTCYVYCGVYIVIYFYLCYDVHYL